MGVLVNSGIPYGLYKLIRRVIILLFLNKITKLQWEISNEEHIKRLLRDSDYKVIEETVVVEEVKLEPEVKKEIPKNIKK